jgi:hypothetical protein
MRFGHISLLASTLLFASALPAAAASGPRVRRGPTANRLAKTKSTRSKTATAQGIAPERATQIQAALIKSGYMTGTPSGTWDAPTQAAMEKMQADNGWQTKLVPDSRAIIKLGLGPHPDGSISSAPVEQPSSSDAANSSTR